MTRRLYAEDLARVHDAGFKDFSLGAAPWLLAQLRRRGLAGGLVVDLGCGSGWWARALLRAGYGVLGADVSRSMLRLARRRAPRARLRRANLHALRLPPCAAVTALGECLAYEPAPRDLTRLFRRVHAALRPGGLFVFDLRAPDPGLRAAPRLVHKEGPGWAVLAVSRQDPDGRGLARDITVFARRRGLYRRTTERHRQRLHRPAAVVRALRAAGFSASVLAGYGKTRFPASLRGFLAVKKTLG